MDSPNSIFLDTYRAIYTLSHLEWTPQTRYFLIPIARFTHFRIENVESSHPAIYIDFYNEFGNICVNIGGLGVVASGHPFSHHPARPSTKSNVYTLENNMKSHDVKMIGIGLAPYR